MELQYVMVHRRLPCTCGCPAPSLLMSIYEAGRADFFRDEETSRFSHLPQVKQQLSLRLCFDVLQCEPSS